MFWIGALGYPLIELAWRRRTHPAMALAGGLSAVTLKAIAKVMDKELPSEGDFQVIGDPDAKVRHPAIVSGGGAWPDIFSEIAAGKVDCLITGEMGHAAFHYALETGTPVLTLGHYRSEMPGVFAVMNTIREKFQIDCEFIDCPTGL